MNFFAICSKQLTSIPNRAGLWVPVSQDAILFCDTKELNLLNHKGSLIRQIPLDDQPLNINYYSQNQVLVRFDGELVLLDVLTGDILKRTSIPGDDAKFLAKFGVWNNKLYCLFIRPESYELVVEGSSVCKVNGDKERPCLEVTHQGNILLFKQICIQQITVRTISCIRDKDNGTESVSVQMKTYSDALLASKVVIKVIEREEEILIMANKNFPPECVIQIYSKDSIALTRQLIIPDYLLDVYKYDQAQNTSILVMGGFMEDIGSTKMESIKVVNFTTFQVLRKVSIPQLSTFAFLPKHNLLFDADFSKPCCIKVYKLVSVLKVYVHLMEKSGIVEAYGREVVRYVTRVLSG